MLLYSRDVKFTFGYIITIDAHAHAGLVALAFYHARVRFVVKAVLVLIKRPPLPETLHLLMTNLCGL